MPDGWAWSRIASLVSINLGLTHTPKYVESGIPFYSVKDISNGYLDESNPKYVSQEEFNTFLEGAKPRKGDIIFCRVGTIGKPHIVNVDYPFGIFVSVGFFRKYSDRINSKYIMDWMNSSLFYEQVDYNVKGGVIKNLNTGWLSEFLIPIPPEKEQQQIVSLNEEIVSKIELLETNKIELQSAINKSKSKILDLAIHGKLVPQDINEEPASVLLDKLRTEKEEKIAKGELKRDKNDSYIYKGSDNCYYEKLNGKEICIDDEIPFEIPENWTWKRGREIFLPMFTRTPGKSGSFKYIDIDAIDNKQHKITIPKTIEAIKAPSRASRGVDTGDVLFSLVRPYLENIALIKEEHADCIASTGFYVCRPNKAVFPEYLFYLMTSNYVIKGLNEFMKGDNSPSISGDDVAKWLYPIPPIEEQKRIVRIINELHTVLDKIQTNVI